MLSRVAERIYWQARYLERVENTARLLNVFSNLLLDLPGRTKLGWRALVRITGTTELFATRYNIATESNLAQFLIADDCDASICSMLSMARENARTTREVMPTEAFERINDLHYYAQSAADSAAVRSARNEMLEHTIESAQQIFGMLAGAMSRDAGYTFVRMGRALERADMVTRIVDVGARKLFTHPGKGTVAPRFPEPYEGILWMSVLRSQSAYQMYRQHVRRRVNGEDVVRFLLQDEEFPRAAIHNLTTISKVLSKLPKNEEVAGLVDEARRHVMQSQVADLIEEGLTDYIDRLQIKFAAIHNAITHTWFSPRN
ncbi:MAG: alpha-E domain-containing protein [Gammaproteobacteria bacterium]|nr:alpha-E domain-containing protein [Gammaproteobacteria bacterium]